MDDHTAPLDVAISGGSMGGLFTGLALGYADRDVEVNVFERSTGQLKHRGAGIVAQPVIVEFLERHGITSREAITTTTRTRQYLDREGQVERAYDEEMTFTSWDAVYRVLRDAFPDEEYHTGRTTVGVDRRTERRAADGDESTSDDAATDGATVLRFDDGDAVRTDLAVIAEGGQSTAREDFLPDITPEYAGYVAWRGVVSEDDVPSAVREGFDDTFTFYEGDDDLILAYFIPGPDGGTKEGERRLNWVWYDAVERAKRRRLLTDIEGTSHEFSVPPGELRPDVDEGLLAAAGNRLPEVFADLVRETDDRFVQTIYDLSVPRMVFSRCCLLGDSAFVARPHTAAGTAKAAADGITLAETLERNERIEAALGEWEQARLDAGRRLVSQGRRMGERYMH